LRTCISRWRYLLSSVIPSRDYLIPSFNSNVDHLYDLPELAQTNVTRRYFVKVTHSSMFSRGDSVKNTFSRTMRQAHFAESFSGRGSIARDDPATSEITCPRRSLQVYTRVNFNTKYTTGKCNVERTTSQFCAMPVSAM
jgi:hypothetical protein